MFLLPSFMMNRGIEANYFFISFWKPVTTAMVIKLTTMVSVLIVDMRMIGSEFIPFLLF